MNIEDDEYLNKLKEIIKQEEILLNNIDGEVGDRLRRLKKIESSLISRLIEERLYLSEKIKIDPLTGLYNRRILSKIRDIGTVIICDVDYFKTINDTYGHSVGDKVIKTVGETILDNIRVGDVGCRYGGDEFLIVFTTDRQDVIDNRMKKIVEEINKKVDIPDFDITLSVGIAFNDNNEKIDSLINKADDALYKSKENGRNQVTYYGIEKDNIERLLKK